MGSRVLRFAFVTVVAVLAVLAMPGPSAEACSPRTSAHLGSPPAERQPAPAPSTGTSQPSVPATNDPATTENPDSGSEEPTGIEAGGEDSEGTGSQPQSDASPVDAPPPAPDCNFVYRIEYPVVGGGEIGSLFGDIRAGGHRWHLGVDIFAPKLTPVVAARAGTVVKLGTEGADCCWLVVRHDDGWSSWYIHLNNDVVGGDGGDGWGVLPGLQVGDRVEQGQVIGWLGDSGNAEPGVPHLHFELRTPWGTAIDPLPSLLWGKRRAATAFADQPDTRPVFSGAFIDDDGHPDESLFDHAVSIGLPIACGEWGVAVCPDQPASRTVALSLVTSLFGTSPSLPLTPLFSDPDPMYPTTDPASMERLQGCHDPVVCHQPITRHELALLIRQMEGTNGTLRPARTFADPVTSGRLDGCAAPDPHQVLTRADLLHTLYRTAGWLPQPPCARIS